tara:strand:+ start:16350 stop:16592 length:243 start_codon:yes stop_codon:yes gene_type:complete
MEYTTTGYSYTTTELAEADIVKLNVHFGIPKTEDSTTRTYAEYGISETSGGVIEFYFIEYDPQMQVVLGDPIELIIHFNI